MSELICSKHGASRVPAGVLWLHDGTGAAYSAGVPHRSDDVMVASWPARRVK